MRRIVSEPHPWLLAIAILLFFRRPLTDSTFFFRDLYQFFYPKRIEMVAALHSHELPLWDPLTHGGQPFLANPANTLFFPSNILFAILPPLLAFNVALVLQFVLCGLAAYALARSIDLSPRAAFVCGTVYAFCGYTLSSACVMPYLLAMPFIPATLACVQTYLRDRRNRWLLLGSFSAACPLLGSAAESAAMMFLLVIGWFAVTSEPPPRKLRVAALLVAGAIGLSLIQILPATEVIARSSRARRRSYEAFAQWSVNPRRLPELIVPHFLGDTDTLDDRDYWGRRIEDRGFPYFLSIYIGVPTLLLAIVGAVGSGPHRRLRRMLFLISMIALVLSLGRALPFFPLLYRLPLIAMFRYPVKALILAMTPLALLAGFGFAVVEERPPRALAVAYAACAAVLGVAAISWGTNAEFARALGRAFFLEPVSVDLEPRMTMNLWHAAAVATASAAAVALTLRRGRNAAMLLSAIILVDLWIAGYRVNAWAPRSLFSPPPLADLVRRTVGSAHFHHQSSTALTALRAPTDDVFWLARRNLEVLNDYTAGLYAIPVIFHTDFDGLAPESTARLTEAIRALPWERRLQLFDLAGIRAFVSADRVSSPQVIDAGRIADRAGLPLHLYILPRVQPVRFVSASTVVRDENGALAVMLNERFNARRLVLIAPAIPHNESCEAIVRPVFSRNSMHIDVEAPCSGFVFFSQSFFPEWKATVDGAATEVLRADYAFSAVAIPAGAHAVEMRYRPRLPIFGALGSLATLIVLLVGAARRAPRPVEVQPT